MSVIVNNARIEKDFLGAKEVPEHAYYGIQTLRAVENFPITGYKIHPELIKAMAMVKKAAAKANTDVGRLYEGIGEAIMKAADEMIEGQWHDQVLVDPIQVFLILPKSAACRSRVLNILWMLRKIRILIQKYPVT